MRRPGGWPAAILWAGGEFVSVTMLGVLVVQWMRQSEREARRVDRALDRAEAAEQAAAGTIGGGDAGHGSRPIRRRTVPVPTAEQHR